MAGKAYGWTCSVITVANGVEQGKEVNDVRGGSWYSTGRSGVSVCTGEGRSPSGWLWPPANSPDRAVAVVKSILKQWSINASEDFVACHAWSGAAFCGVLMINQDRLWQQVAAFQFDDNQSAFTLTQRLARENGWSFAFARRVMEEYRRFIYLAVRAGHPVTPSEEVDQAWHLHMIYTRSYWDELCRDVLGQPLHHGPTKGGKDEEEKFHDWYEATLASYRRLFEMEPPDDIWPPSVVRFSREGRFMRVDASQVWMIPKTWLRRSLAMAVVVAGSSLLLMACNSSSDQSHDASLRLIIFFLAICVLLALAAGKNDRGPKNGKKGCGGGDGGFSSFFSSGCSSGDSGGGHSGCGGASGCGGSSGCGGGGCGGGGCGGGGD